MTSSRFTLPWVCVFLVACGSPDDEPGHAMVDTLPDGMKGSSISADDSILDYRATPDTMYIEVDGKRGPRVVKWIISDSGVFDLGTGKKIEGDGLSVEERARLDAVARRKIDSIDREIRRP